MTPLKIAAKSLYVRNRFQNAYEVKNFHSSLPTQILKTVSQRNQARQFIFQDSLFKDLLEKLFLSSVSKWLLCLVSCSLLNCNDHCKLLQKTYQNPWYCFSMGWTRNIYISSVFSPTWFQKNMIHVINTRDLFIEQLTTDKKFREGRLGVFLSFKNWKCKLIPQAHC